MEKEFLNIACRKHISEIIIQKAFTVCTCIVTRGPDIPLSCDSITDGSPSQQIASKHLPTFLLILLKSLPSCYLQLVTQQSWNDYRKLLELTVFVLGAVPSPGFHILWPGTYHLAHWKDKFCYSVKIYLFHGQYKLTGKNSPHSSTSSSLPSHSSSHTGS